MKLANRSEKNPLPVTFLDSYTDVVVRDHIKSILFTHTDIHAHTHTFVTISKHSPCNSLNSVENIILLM